MMIHYADVARLFRAGKDTLDIARHFGVPEHIVANLLNRALDRTKPSAAVDCARLKECV